LSVRQKADGVHSLMLFEPSVAGLPSFHVGTEVLFFIFSPGGNCRERGRGIPPRSAKRPVPPSGVLSHVDRNSYPAN
jgi:hypothetical protein